MTTPGSSSPTWALVLAHRDDDERPDVIERFEAVGVQPHDVQRALADGGDRLFAAVRDEQPDWTDEFGGPAAVAMLAAEVSALAAHLNARASVVRGRAVSALLDDYSAISVAAALGVSRQKIYDLARPGPRVRHPFTLEHA